MKTGEISLSLSSITLGLLDIDKAISSMNFGSYVRQIPDYEEHIATAYELFFDAVTGSFPYTLDVEFGEATCDGLPDYNVDFDVQTDVATIFSIHKDVYTKCKDDFDKWLRDKKQIREHPEYPENIDEFFRWIEGDDIETAISAYLNYLVQMKYTEKELKSFLLDFSISLEDSLFGSVE